MLCLWFVGEEELLGCAMKARVVVLAAAVVAAACLALHSRRDVALVEMREAGRVELIPVDGGAAGPESLAFGGDGDGPYTGVSDGRILRWQPRERRWVEHSCSAPELLDKCRGSQDPRREHECGRPLGLKFNHNTGELYVADAYLGLRVIGPEDNTSRQVVSESMGSPFSFTNGLDIDQATGVVYFTDSSRKFHRREFLKAVLSSDNTGRLMKYDPRNNRVEVLVDGLSFPNGLAISKDGSFLLIVETTTGKILKYWLQTPKSSTLEEIAQLSWFPDNIKASPRGGFWVGLHSKRGKIAQWAMSYPWLRKTIFKQPTRRVERVSSLLNRFGRQVVAVRLSEEGEVVEEASVHGDARRAFKFVSEVEERNGSLWIGSVVSPFLGVYHL